MPDALYDKINEIAQVGISLASPEDIRSWSYGEVKKPETINYRTYRPEKDGLFCEKIFGPEKDYECFCGKYKGIKYKGIVCERCGVKVTTSKVRRKRMGHINLAAPVAHIWFFKAMPSRIGALINVKASNLERVIYFQDYIVIDPGKSDLKERELINEEKYREMKGLYGDNFKAGMGAEALRALLQKLELPELAGNLRRELIETNSKQKQKDLIKRLKTVEALKESGNKPEWMVLDVVPVIPPDLRPLVQLESGNFATSDLNDLYRRLINRNNRLKKLIDLNAPEVIIRNEKRMLQQAADALFDNNRCRRPVLGSRNRPLKSLTDMIKGKQGRFRENLLGKRVDYSARSVIVVEPELKLHQCGLPKKIALELFQPFVIRRLKELGMADTIKSAKKMLERKDEEVWDILEEVIHKHPVLLNRAPTLHRMGIQAFEPVLVEGNAIKIHPLVCQGFNADFDGDQMAVHLPLSFEAQIEAHTLMLSIHNIFSPAHGNPIITPSQDMVLGLYYMTADNAQEPGEGKMFSSADDVIAAYSHGKLGTHAKIKVLLAPHIVVYDEKGNVTCGDSASPNVDWTLSLDPGEYAGSAHDGFVEEAAARYKPFLVETTPGRILFNDILPKGMPFFNYAIGKKQISAVIAHCYKRLGRIFTLRLLDDIKEFGFKSATRAGVSIGKDDMKSPDNKQVIIDRAQKTVDELFKRYREGVITDRERRNHVIDEWTHAREEIGRSMMDALKNDVRLGKPYLNPIYMMVTSGARGSTEQVRQLAGMRGLMAKPGGEIIEAPIKANFREGLKVLEYFSSTHGARKGLADTALKTADSGYLTRKLADVAQTVVITEHDCGTENGVDKRATFKGEKVEISLAESIRGRVTLDTIKHPQTKETLIEKNSLISAEMAAKIESLGFTKIRVRSGLTCDSLTGVCQLCYGADLSRDELVELGTAVGIIAAQSIGEPGTQLTMRTFHIGGAAARASMDKDLRVTRGGKVRFEKSLRVVENPAGEKISVSSKGEIKIVDEDGNEIEKYTVPLGATLKVEDGGTIKAGKVLCEWDPHTSPVVSEVDGRVVYDDLIEGRTFKEDVDPTTKQKAKVVIEHKGDLHPQLRLEDKSGEVIAYYPLPEKATILIADGAKVRAGQILAKTVREIGGTQDITGGLPRVTELLEARRPKDPAYITKIDGVVEITEDKKRGKRNIVVKSESGEVAEHAIPSNRVIKVRTGDRVKAGEPLTEGSRVPQDVLEIQGKEAVQEYLLGEVQKVYRSQNVGINDKHIEIIVSQMLRKVRIANEGNTNFLRGTVVDRADVIRENRRVMEEGGKPAAFKPLLLGITKASLQSDSFLSSASFQETTKVLTEAAISGKKDTLGGLKENIILGHRIPAGSGFSYYHQMNIKYAQPMPAPAPEGEAAGAAAS
ncbi:MAG: DNA-directed RNA polymerase subunit beta' [Planctomycetota bacterium]|nr:MAG: DNA-directed RNA polymerase subunit beta' [Planctomycetota bacterium]